MIGDTVELWVTEAPGDDPRLLNKVKPSSQWSSIGKKYSTSTLDGRLDVARRLRDGWRANGPWPLASFRIMVNGEEIVT